MFRTCPKCRCEYINEYLIKLNKKGQPEYKYECSDCLFSWTEPYPQKYLTYHAPKEIEERRKQPLSKLTKEDWIELQIDIYEFEHGHTI
jgi:hypothetical protein